MSEISIKIETSKMWMFSFTCEPGPGGLYECLGLHKKNYSVIFLERYISNRVYYLDFKGIFVYMIVDQKFFLRKILVSSVNHQT